MLDRRFPGPERIARQVLPNGITVLAYENFTVPVVYITGVLQAGALYEPASRAGLADFTAEMLLRGTRQRTAAQIYEALEGVGAGLHFGSGRHVTDFSGSSLTDDVNLLLDLLAAALREPLFEARQVQRVRRQILTDLEIRANDTHRMANLTFMETLYQGHPYGRSVVGYPETIKAIERADLSRFHSEHYGPRGMIVAIVGAIAAPEAIDRVSSVLGDWTNPQQSAILQVPDAARPPAEVTRFVPMPEKAQADIVLGLPGPRRSAPDYLHASLLNTILGVLGMMGRIGAAVRVDQGLAYYASSELSGGLGPAPWSADAGVAPRNVARAIRAIVQEIERIQEDPVPEDELADAKSYRVGSLPVQLETNEALADIMTDLELYGLGLDYLQRFPGQLQDITAEQVQAAARKYLSAQEMVVVVAGPQA